MIALTVAYFIIGFISSAIHYGITSDSLASAGWFFIWPALVIVKILSNFFKWIAEMANMLYWEK